MEEAIKYILTTWGGPGAIIIVLGYAYYLRDTSYREVQEKRVAEAQANTEKMLIAINFSANTTVANTTALNALTDFLKATRGRE